MPHIELGFVESSDATDADRPLNGVHVVTPDQDSLCEQIRHHLVVIQPGDQRVSDPAWLDHIMAHVAGHDATALAVTREADGSVDSAVRAAANRHGVLLLAITQNPAAWFRLHRSIVEDAGDHSHRTTTLQCELLELTHHLGRPDGAQRLVSWLAQVAVSHATVTSPQGATVAAAPADAPLTLRPAAQKIADLAGTGRGSAALDTGGRQIRLYTVGNNRPAPVLAVAAESFTPDTNLVIARVLDLLAAQTALEQAARGRERLREGEESVRQAVLELLMTGHLVDARRTAVGLGRPGTLDFEDCRVLVVKTLPVDRDTVIQQCLDAVGTNALVSGCQACPEEVIVVAPVTNTDCGVVQDLLLQDLTRITHGAPHRYLGVSRTHRLAETAQAYLDANRAVTAAQQTPGRVHLQTTEAPLALILDARADAWAGALLAPVLDLPESRREQLLATLRPGLDHTPAATARMLGTHRNTVARRLAEAADALGAELQCLAQRTVLGLALEVRERAGRTPETAGERTVLSDLLGTADVRRWAEDFLGRLQADRRPLRRTLAAWVGANTRVEDTAAVLDLNPVTVRAHLRSAEQLLERRLVTGASVDGTVVAGAHDVVLALAILGDVPLPELR